MADDDERSPLADLDRRLRAAEEARRASLPQERPPNRAMGIAYRLSVEMVAGLVVGGGVGWGFDLLFGTKPWFLVVFFLLGAAAGMLNAVRAARAIQAEADRAEEEARNARPERK